MDLLAPTRERGRPEIATTDLVGNRGYNRGQEDDLDDRDYTTKFGGNSAAAPQVAAALALMMSVHPDLTRDEAYKILRTTADKIQPERARYNDAGHSDRYGYGRLDVEAALLAILQKQQRQR